MAFIVISIIVLILLIVTDKTQYEKITKILLFAFFSGGMLILYAVTKPSEILLLGLLVIVGIIVYPLIREIKGFFEGPIGTVTEQRQGDVGFGGYVITDADPGLFGGYHIKYCIDEDGTVYEPSGGWKKIVGYVHEDGTITDADPGFKHILGYIKSDGTITDASAGYKHILGHIINN